MDTDPHPLDPDTMRALGHRIVDLLHAGFTYPRTATVVATTPVRLLVIPGGLVPELARRIPRMGERLRAAARERLPSV